MSKQHVGNFNELDCLRGTAHKLGGNAANKNEIGALRTIVTRLNAVPAGSTVGNMGEMQCLRAIVNHYTYGADVTVPTLSSATIDAAGTTLTLVFSEAVIGVLQADYALSTGTLSDMAGSGATRTFTITPAIQSGAVITLDYNGASTEDAAGNDLAAIADGAVTNNSTQSSLLIDEDFEGAGTPSGFTVESGSPDFDNATSPIAGSQDLLFASGVASEITIDFADSDELWITFRRKSSSFDQGTFFYAIKADFSQVVALRRSAANANKLIFLQGASEVGSASVDSLPISDTYYFFHVKKGAGANAEYEASFSTDGTRPTSGNTYISHTSGTFTGQFEKLYIIHRNTEVWTDQYDNLKVSSTGWPS